MEGNWKINRYKKKFEPNEQWEMRRKFMEVNKNKFPEDRVVCLAQVLVNMEFLGTKYPIETMQTVNELSQEMIEEFRDRQKIRIQRTFVGGTDAANSKVNGKRSTISELKSEDKNKKRKEEKNSESNANYFLSAITSSNSKSVTVEKSKTLNQIEQKRTGKRRSKKEANSGAEETLMDNVESSDCMITWDSSQVPVQSEEVGETISKKKKFHQKPGEISNFVIITLQYENDKPSNYREIIELSARLSAIPLQVHKIFLEGQGIWESVLLLNGITIASAEGRDEKLSQRNVYKTAFDILIKTHYRIVVTDKTCVSVKHFMSQVEDARLIRAENTLSTTITKQVMGGKASESRISKEELTVEQPVKSTVAMQIMKMMGWTEGTGLGLKQQGIVEPVKSGVVVGRQGVGYDGSGKSKSFHKLIRRYLQNYKNSDSVHSIIFSNEFSTKERKSIHSIAHQMGMLSSSIGKKPNRQLTVRRAPCEYRPLVELLNQLIESKGSDPLFSLINLIPPTD